MSINGEEMVLGRLYTLSPDDSVHIDGNDFVYRLLTHLGDDPRNKNNYVKQLQIGSGAEGVVSMARCTTTGCMVAIKKVQMRHGSFEKYANEIRLWEGLHHRNVNSMVDWYRDPDKPALLYIVSHLAPHQSLYHYIERFGGLAEELAKPVLAQIIDGLTYMHAQGFLHRDIKPENILVFHIDESGVLTVKITDFGTCIPINENPDANVDRAGTANWAAPEVAISRNNEISEAFCVGGVMFFILFAERPFLVSDQANDMAEMIRTRLSQLDRIGPDEDDEEMDHEDTDHHRPTRGDADREDDPLTRSARRLLHGLLKENPAERMNLIQARQSSWLQGCAVPQARVQPLFSRHPLAHNLFAILQCHSLDPPPIPRLYTPGVPVVRVLRRLRTPISNYLRGSTEPLASPGSPISDAVGAIGFPRSNRTPGSTGLLSAHHSSTTMPVHVKTETVYDIDLATPPTSLALPGINRAGPATPCSTLRATPALPIGQEHVERAAGAKPVPSAVLEHEPISAPDAAVTVDGVRDAAEEPEVADADALPTAVVLEASRPRRTRARARAEKGASFSIPKLPVRRSSRIRDRRAGTAGEKFAASYGAQAASGVKVEVTGEKRKLGTRVEEISKKRKTD
ncbi:kinase-like protein [Punctularia strigosozonata HHB-11173 SS5]|uniref:kinase-like protein n=1 Tax=Punctularia strigosozonata (strain HHB-11173) TaxID=741275 RepID=UPI0004418499|nr:kinase-like protein [Punctularia strigosozonata HHB-11173 SS5]EIN06919.1 kinase-like protein [Punctularia strigosozonata HHB-11173 SS5]